MSCRSGGGGKLGALDEEIGENPFVILVSGDATIVGLEFAASLLNEGEKGIQLGEVLIADERWFSHKAAVCFEINETDGTIELEIEFGRIEQMNNREIM